MKTNLGLVEYVKQALKGRWGYVWGTYGLILTPELLEKKKNQYPDQVGGYLKTIKSLWIGTHTVDCIGLIKAYLWSNDTTGIITYNSATDLNTGGMYSAAKEKGPIATIPEIPGLAVYKQGHIGVYVGNGMVIEARTTSKGVIQSPLKGAESAGWTHWLKIPYITYSQGANGMIKPVLKLGSRGTEVKELQENLIKLGYNVGKSGADGIFGNDTFLAVKRIQGDNGLKPIDGIVGKDTHGLIEELLKPVTKLKYAPGYQKARKFDSDIHIYGTTKKEFVDVELGQVGRLETVKTIMDLKKQECRNAVAGINLGFFNFNAKPEHLGMYIDEGKYYYPPTGDFIDFIYYKNGTSEIKNLNGYDKTLLSTLQAETYWAVGVGWSLIQKGAINLENASKFSHSTERQPRTLFGIRRDGTFVLVVVDGRTTKSKGVTAQQSAQIMMELECYNACNGDGGGSSYMVVGNKLVSSPSDGSMRAIGSAMLVYSDKPITNPIINYTTFPTVKIGSNNTYVGMVQKRLMELGYNLMPYGADNSFGTLTDTAIRAFQKSRGLIVDGIVGQATYKELF